MNTIRPELHVGAGSIPNDDHFVDDDRHKCFAFAVGRRIGNDNNAAAGLATTAVDESSTSGCSRTRTRLSARRQLHRHGLPHRRKAHPFARPALARSTRHDV